VYPNLYPKTTAETIRFAPLSKADRLVGSPRTAEYGLAAFYGPAFEAAALRCISDVRLVAALSLELAAAAREWMFAEEFHRPI
jgi:hypothetical protein